MLLSNNRFNYILRQKIQFAFGVSMVLKKSLAIHLLNDLADIEQFIEFAAL